MNEGITDIRINPKAPIETRIWLLILNEFTKCNVPAEYRANLRVLQKRVEQILKSLVAELKLKKKFGTEIDLQNSENQGIDLHNVDNPYWLKGNITQPRPPGPTNQEVSDMLSRIRKIIFEADTDIMNMSRQQIGIIHIPSKYETRILDEIRDTFTIPNQNIPFSVGFYDRTNLFPFNKTQNTPCEICGENRATDKCHIVPASAGGKVEPQNILYLCPTHHRLFDRLMLSKEEWDKIEWHKKGKTATNFAYHILLPEIKRFWDKIVAGRHEKNTVNWDATNHYQNAESFAHILITAMHDKIDMTLAEITKAVRINPYVVPIQIRELRKRGKVLATRKNDVVVYTAKPEALDDVILKRFNHKDNLTESAIIKSFETWDITSENAPNIPFPRPELLSNRIQALVENGKLLKSKQGEETTYWVPRTTTVKRRSPKRR